VNESVSQARCVILVVGGGFSGCMAAVNILRKDWQQEVEVLLVERSGATARGVAYGTTHDWHYLNVHAANMSALAEEPGDLGRYLAKVAATDSGNDGQLDAEWWRTYVTRKQYSQYLQELLDSVSNLGPRKKLTVLNDEVIDLKQASDADSDGIQALFSSGRAEKVDFAILALGNASPTVPAVLARNLSGHPQLVGDPWKKDWEKQLKKTDTVLLLGTGLTMVDKVLELASHEHTGEIIAISRHGLLPQPHKPELLQQVSPALPKPFTAKTVREAMRWIRQTARDKNMDWRPVLDSLRSYSKDWWHSLPMPEKRRFLRHAQCYWDVHRHRMAPQVAAHIDELIAHNKLRIMAGRAISSKLQNGRVIFEYMPRHNTTGKTETISVDVIINCTGAETRLEKTPHPLLASLWKQKAICSNELDLGLRVSDTCNIVAGDGSVSENVFAIGPPLRGSFFETIAVPELRQQANSVAKTIFERRANGKYGNCGTARLDKSPSTT
jgi:uncharacterized NAD(P)/FAD-binding protein YdhS